MALTVKPLENFQVVSLAINIPGPVAAARLRDLGARVIKIEPPSGDLMAWGSPAWYAALHKGVEIRVMDLKTAENQQTLQRILSRSDLLLTSSRPQALIRLGLDWSVISEKYPRLCQVAIVGSPPPNENKAGHDLTYQAGAGLVRPSALPTTTIADLAGAERAVQTALGLLLARERGMKAGYELVSLVEAAEFYAEPLRRGLTTIGGPLGGGLPGYGLYETAAGWVAVAVLEPHFLARLTAELNINEMSQAALAQVLLEKTAEDWEIWAAEKDIPLIMVQEI